MLTRLLRRVRLCEVRTIRLAPALVAFLALSVFVPAAAAGTLDQSQPTISPNVTTGAFGDVFHGAQTFTSGLTGGLDQVDFAIGRTLPSITVPLLAEIRPVSGARDGGRAGYLRSRQHRGGRLPGRPFLQRRRHRHRLRPLR